MTAHTMEELVSQSESEGVTLAEFMASRLSANDLEQLQQDLGRQLADNYSAIEAFMAEVEVPSIADFSNLSITDLDEMEGEITAALSDEAAALH